MLRFCLLMPVAFISYFSTNCLPTGGYPENPSPEEAELIVNIQVDAEQEDVDGLERIAQELLRREIPATVFVTADYANQHSIEIHNLYTVGFEIAQHGYYTGEELATMTYEDQLDLIARAIDAVDGCQPCGKYQEIAGFRPQYFSQNEDTFDVLDELGIEYNCGFKAGLIDIEGYENADEPFLVPGHQFYAVPFTVVEYDGKQVYLCDIASALSPDLGFTAEQWAEVLDKAIEQCIANDVPLVLLVHGWYTGDTAQYDYWPVFEDFLDTLQGRAAYITTEQLVDRYKNASAAD